MNCPTKTANWGRLMRGRVVLKQNFGQNAVFE